MSTELEDVETMDFTPDNRYLVCAYSSSRKIGIFRLTPEGGSLFREFPIGGIPTPPSPAERGYYPTRLFVSETGERMCIVVVCGDKDTVLRVYDGSGTLKARVDNAQLENYGSAFNYHRDFFATGSFAPDSKVYAITRATTTREFAKFGKVMVLAGPRSSVFDVAFDQHDRAAAISKDGFFYLWTVDVRYQLSEDPRLLSRAEVSKEARHVALHPTEDVGEGGGCDVDRAGDGGSRVRAAELCDGRDAADHFRGERLPRERSAHESRRKLLCGAGCEREAGVGVAVCVVCLFGNALWCVGELC